jgi:hypothetical protein
MALGGVLTWMKVPAKACTRGEDINFTVLEMSVDWVIGMRSAKKGSATRDRPG